VVVDRITVMRSFVGVAEERSFSHAARRLGISGSLVSRHVAELEKQLGIRLVNRTARAVSLTDAGTRYQDFAARIIGELDAEDVAIRGLRDKPEGPLAVICPKWIGNLDLGEAIADFSVDYPRIQVRFEVGGMSDKTFDFLDRGYDVAFHTKELRDSSVLLKKIADLHFLLCASPGYVERAGRLEEPADLAEHDCLAHINDPIWYLRRDGRESHVKIPHPAYSSNSYLTLRKAAVRGRGVALMPVRTVMSDVTDGSLQQVLPDYEGPARSLYAIHSPGTHTLRKVRLFLDYVANWFTEHPMAAPPVLADAQR
jgi:DNA-binding transcriptional LysR family regulator